MNFILLSEFFVNVLIVIIFPVWKTQRMG